MLEISQQTKQKNSSKTVVVGMSGGVDSSVTALILKEQGYNVIGMYMKNWEELDENGNCTSEADYEDVAQTCAQINIPFRAIDFVKEYKDNVFSHFLTEYKKGNTPNPDILCNREIKFKVFYNKAMEIGADYLATGHYCRTDGERLLKGVDQGKDQSYFLYAISKDVLKNVLFPVGELEKPQVREIAAKYDLPTKTKKDSTGICFIGERNFRNFLSEYIETQKGDFCLLDGTKVGRHEGACFYTVGQRKSLGLGGQGERWFVVDKDISKNIVYVERGNHPKLYTMDLIGDNITWIDEPKEFPYRCKAKIRYRQEDQDCTLFKTDGDLIKVVFDSPQKGAAVGQSIVFYSEDNCLGGVMVKSLGKDFHELGLNAPES